MFERSARGRDRFVYIEFISGVLEVLGLERDSEAGLDLVITYAFGWRRGGWGIKAGRGQ